MLPDLSAVPSWAAGCLVALTTVTTALVTLARTLVRALPQTAPARLDGGVSYSATASRFASSRTPAGRTAAAPTTPVYPVAIQMLSVPGGGGQRESADP